MTSRLQNRRDTATNWTTNNPTLAAGELGYETDTKKIKIGDGSTAWTSLAYYVTGTGGETLLSTTTLSGTSTTISSIDQTYKSLIIVIENLIVSSQTAVLFEINGLSNGGWWTAGGYGNTSGVNQANTPFTVDGWTGNVIATGPVTGSIRIDDYASTATGSYKATIGAGNFYHTSQGQVGWFNAGGWVTSSAITSLTIKSNGTPTLTGTIKLYGVN